MWHGNRSQHTEERKATGRAGVGVGEGRVGESTEGQHEVRRKLPGKLLFVC